MRIVQWRKSCSERTDRQINMKNLIISFRKLAQEPTKINVASAQNNQVHTKCKYILSDLRGFRKRCCTRETSYNNANKVITLEGIC